MDTKRPPEPSDLRQDLQALATATSLRDRPEWLDAKGIRARFSLCKSTLYRLADERKIRSASLRERNKLRGKRLSNCDSVAAYIESLAVGGTEALDNDGSAKTQNLEGKASGRP